MSKRNCSPCTPRRRVSFSGAPPREADPRPGTSRQSCQCRRTNIPEPVSRGNRFLGARRSHTRCGGACSAPRPSVVAVPFEPPAPWQDEAAALPPRGNNAQRSRRAGTSRQSCQSRRTNIPQPVPRGGRSLGSRRSHTKCGGACSAPRPSMMAVPLDMVPFQDQAGPSARAGTSRQSCQSRRTNIPRPVSARGSKRSHSKCGGACNSAPRPSMMAVPLDMVPWQDEAAALPPAEASIECVAQVVQDRLLMQEREEHEAMERSLLGMQQFRRSYVMAALRDNGEDVMANLNEVVNAPVNAPEPPMIDVPDQFELVDAEDPPAWGGISFSSGSDPSLGQDLFEDLSSDDDSSSGSFIEDESPPEFLMEDSSEGESGFVSGCGSEANSLQGSFNAPPDPPIVVPQNAQAVIQAAAHVVGVQDLVEVPEDYHEFAAGIGQCPSSSFY